MSRLLDSPQAIEFDGIWKKFRRGEMHDSLRDLVPALVRRITGRTPRTDDIEGGEFWALSDVSFRVEPGSALGIIGANGAGKSTTLKILTKILRQTRGRYVLSGRVGALIEVAAGFHQDLTGRENVFLQGAIMGMPQTHIRKKFDEIVAFSGIQDFIDTPVKRYSSGMNARLGFSIAVHLDPDALIIDEVLAVGDVEFQRTAFDRIRSLARSGIPVVVVSHQLDRVAELCTQALLLRKGRVIKQGSPSDVIAEYVRGTISEPEQRTSDERLIFESVRLADAHAVPSGGTIAIAATVRVEEGLPKHIDPFTLTVTSAQTGQRIFSTGSTRLNINVPGPGRYDFVARLQMNVPPGVYVVETMGWDIKRSTLYSQGPQVAVRVDPIPGFWGTVQLNPSMTMTDSPPETRTVAPAVTRA
jgi:ABC-type polysaccharide/polyol phosphate transport system ATPase subunit